MTTFGAVSPSLPAVLRTADCAARGQAKPPFARRPGCVCGQIIRKAPTCLQRLSPQFFDGSTCSNWGGATPQCPGLGPSADKPLSPPGVPVAVGAPSLLGLLRSVSDRRGEGGRNKVGGPKPRLDYSTPRWRSSCRGLPRHSQRDHRGDGRAAARYVTPGLRPAPPPGVRRGPVLRRKSSLLPRSVLQCSRTDRKFAFSLRELRSAFTAI